jgi:DNA primase
MFMRKKIAELAQISEAEVQDVLKLPQPSKPPAQERQKQSRAPISIKKRLMLAALMQPALMREDDLKLVVGDDAESQLLRAVIEVAIAQPQAKPSALLRAVSQQQDARLVQEVSRELLLLDESVDIGLELAGIRTQLMGATQTHQGKQILSALKEKTFAALTEEEREQLRRLTQKSG